MRVGEIPVFIVNKNWLTPLVRLVTWLLTNGTKRIVILDNGSTYPQLLEYYQGISRLVEIRMGNTNDWQYRFWNEKIQEEFDSPYIVTDPDVYPADNCPADLVVRMWEVLNRHPECGKVGPGLRIDNLPEEHPATKMVVEGQSPYWKNKIEDGVWQAPIDTTFAIYGRRSPGADSSHGLRLDFPYVFEHMPWYIWPPTEEAKYYVRHVNPGAPSGLAWYYKHFGLSVNEE